MDDVILQLLNRVNRPRGYSAYNLSAKVAFTMHLLACKHSCSNIILSYHDSIKISFPFSVVPYGKMIGIWQGLKIVFTFFGFEAKIVSYLSPDVRNVWERNV